ncbi:MAG: hypothetical protein ACYSWU_13230, partial [Planctomycetota bacterium]
MKIGKLELARQDNELICSFPVSFPDGTPTLWYALPLEFSDLVSDRSDAALVALLIPAMARGEDVYVDGTISETLYYNLSRSYQHVLRTIIPKLRHVKVFAADVA